MMQRCVTFHILIFDYRWEHILQQFVCWLETNQLIESVYRDWAVLSLEAQHDGLFTLV
jgi:hypothetical protein